jgi:multicomponent Na+:H+ antiporter subunit G
MSMVDVLSTALLVSGAVFFLAGTVGIIRLPDVYTRLHALTKADNLGLGLISAGLMLQSGSLPGAMKLALIWFLVISNSSTISYLIAHAARVSGVSPWRKGDGER